MKAKLLESPTQLALLVVHGDRYHPVVVGEISYSSSLLAIRLTK